MENQIEIRTKIVDLLDQASDQKELMITYEHLSNFKYAKALNSYLKIKSELSFLHKYINNG